MKISTLALFITAALLAHQASADDFGLGSLGTGNGHSGFLEDSHAAISSRTMYYSADNRSGTANDLREAATLLRFDYKSGYTQGTLGVGFDVMAFGALRLDGGDGHTAGPGLAGNGNSFFPTKNNGTEPADSFGRAAGNVKFRISQTELHVGGGLAPVLPILVSNDSRVAPQTFDGGILTSSDIPNVTFTGGELNHAQGRASSNSTGLSVAGATRDSNSFKFGGLDYKPFGSSDNAIAKNLTLQYYYADLEDFYKQNYFGLVHVLPLGNDQSFKTDLRYFDSTSDGKNGSAGYAFNNNGGYAKHAGEVDNKTYSAAFTYQLGGSSLMLGHIGVSDDGGFVWVNQGSIADPNAQGAGGSDFYLFTDAVVGQFSRAGEQVNFGQYSYDFKAYVPGLKASIAYLDGTDIKSKVAGGADQKENETDFRLDYVVQEGPLKGFGTTFRTGTYHGHNTGTADQDQTRLIFNYTYAIF
ncbi:OprD family outer membrane porin [Pseudomonas sp. TE24901]